MFRIQPYNSAFYTQWNDFVARSKNGTFLFHRDFMEYHADRFTDSSLLVFDGSKLVAILPANRVGDTVYSHQGLTYGGLVYGSKIRLAQVASVYKEILLYFENLNIDKLHIKPVPAIYHTMPAQEQEYALFLMNAKLVRRDALCVIENRNQTEFNELRKRGIRNAGKQDIVVKEENDLGVFWNEVLIPNLNERYNVNPVHTVEEIACLRSKFPENIRHFNVYVEGKIAGGTTMFITGTVAHAQYISKTKEDKNSGAFDYLYDYLIKEFSGKNYFDFGISTEEQGRKLNEGLQFWKESFGARAIVQDFYEVAVSNHTLLDNVLSNKSSH